MASHRFVRVFAATSLLVTVLFFAPSGLYAANVKGDVTGERVVAPDDAQCGAGVAAGKTDCYHTGTSPSTADIDGDGRAGLTEMSFALQAAVKVRVFDFGDLADPTFPTLLNSTSSRVPGRTGPRHLDVSMEWVGPVGCVSVPDQSTTKEANANVVNLDQDNGEVLLTRYTFGGIQSRYAVCSVPVSLSPNHDGTMVYLNVAADFNGDNQFERYDIGGGIYQEEWVVTNLPVNNHPGTCRYYASPFILEPGQPIDSEFLRPGDDHGGTRQSFRVSKLRRLGRQRTGGRIFPRRDRRPLHPVGHRERMA